MGEFDLIIFDCDGVLVDSEAMSAEILIDELGRAGIAVDRAHVVSHFLGRSFPTVAAQLRRESGRDLPEDLEMRYRARLLERFETGGLTATLGVVDLLRRLDRPSCVATSSSPARVDRALALTGLDRFFGGRVFTASEVARGKPEPDLFLHAAARMGAGAPSRVLVIEDSVPGLVAARAAGMPMLQYCGGAHLAGVAAPVPPFPVQSFADWSAFGAMLGLSAPEPAT